MSTLETVALILAIGAHQLIGAHQRQQVDIPLRARAGAMVSAALLPATWRKV